MHSVRSVVEMVTLTNLTDGSSISDDDVPGIHATMICDHDTTKEELAIPTKFSL